MPLVWFISFFITMICYYIAGTMDSKKSPLTLLFGLFGLISFSFCVFATGCIAIEMQEQTQKERAVDVGYGKYIRVDERTLERKIDPTIEFIISGNVKQGDK